MNNSLGDQSQAAAANFQKRSAHHARSAFWHSRTKKVVAVASLFALLLIVLVTAVDISRTKASGRYAHGLHWITSAGDKCDASLGMRQFWFLDFVSAHEMCVEHTQDRKNPTLAEDGLRFLIVGDWGRDGTCCQRDVALEMAERARLYKPKPSFVVSTGDNFYRHGIETSRDKQVDRSWRDVYITPYKALQIPWKMTLGNHDHEGNIGAQKVLGREDPFWHMPDSHYFESFGSAENEVFMAFIDTTVLYYPEAMFTHFKGGMSLYTRDNQVAKIKAKLNESTAKWKLVFGHHPLFSSGENAREEKQNLKQLRTILLHVFKEHGVAAYFCGHEHLMEHHIVDGVHFFVSGAGSKLSSVISNQDGSLFVLDRQGFMDVLVRNDSSMLTARMLDMRGSLMHEANITRPS